MSRTRLNTRDALLLTRWHGRPLIIVALSALLGVSGFGCGGPIPPPAKDLEYTQAMSNARISFERGHPEQAALLYEQALRRAEARDDAADIADAAYDLALCLIRTKQYERVHILLTEARQELARAGLRFIDVQLLEAKLAYQTDDLSAADQIAAGITKTQDATGAERCAALILRGAVAMDKGDPRAAATFAAQARAALGKGTVVGSASRAALTAGILGIEARLAGSNPMRAASLYDQQARFWQESGLYADMSEALFQAARAFSAGGSHRSAAQRYARTARSRYAQGDIAGAAKAADEARAEAQQAGDFELIATMRLQVSRPATQESRSRTP